MVDYQSNKVLQAQCCEHIAIDCPMKRTFVFSEELNGWIEKSDDDCQEDIVDKEERPITRAKAMRMEEEHKSEVALFKKMLQDVPWLVLEKQQEDFGGSKTFLFSKVKKEESKEASLGGFVASKPKEQVILDPTAYGRVPRMMKSKATYRL
ncbi:hypothetical protein M9H77_30510 [Catharanthus roseus]|uniref:Uncharacterized protein n=1 Tax=Catharanthus roseus TaxID=4058 RepID=A0ACB9ZXF7_CATRO|nr:hypothetical protein M9H77_30510 [Catharanthus roseus]